MVKSDTEIRVADIVICLAYGIALVGFLSVVRHLELPYTSAFLILFSLAAYREYRHSFLFPRWILTFSALSVILFAFFRFRTDDLIDVSVEALVLLLAIKLLEDKRFRDYMQIFAIVFLLLAGSALLSLDLDFPAYLICLIFLVNTAIVFLAYYSEDNSLSLKKSVIMKITAKTSLIPLLSIPFMLFLFIVLPRSSYPFLRFLQKGPVASTGFTDAVRLGQVSNIQEDATVIFRAEMEHISDDLLYWRGIVLDSFNGTSWERLSDALQQADRIMRPAGKRVTQTIYLEPYENRYLFSLDKPVSVSLRQATGLQDLTYSLPQAVQRRTVYEAESVLSPLIADKKIDLDRYLRVPSDMPKVSELVLTLSSGKDHAVIVQDLLRYFLNGSYRYSLESLPVSDTPLEDFLFKQKFGNCEYFASAMAVMLRFAGIPSRVVGGYRGGYYNDTGGYYLVLQKNAHVWVEAYIDGQGWLRVDPTPAGSDVFSTLLRGSLFFRLQLFLDTLNYYWNATVITYDLKRQVSLFSKLKTFELSDIWSFMKKDSSLFIITVLLAIASGVLLTFTLLSLKQPVEQKLLQSFLRRLRKKGYIRKPSEGLEEFASGIRDAFIRERACTFVRVFEQAYYRDRKFSAEEIRRLKQLLSEIRRS